MKLWQAFFVVFLLHVLAVGGIFAFNSLKSGREKAAPAVAKTAPVEPAKPAAVPETPAKTEPAPVGKTHTVVAGETLSRIASQHGTSVRLLEEANNIASGATIRVGQVLTIPSAPAQSAKPALQPAAAPVAKPVAAKAEPKPAAPVVAKTEPKPAPSVAPKPAEAAAKPAAAASSAGGVYVVEKGDNPYSIAKKLKVSYSDLLKKNNIEDPTKLQIGQKLLIP